MKRCRAGIDDARVLSANRPALVLECILIDTVHTHTHTNTHFIHKSHCSHSLLGTIIILISINIRLTLFFPSFLPPFSLSISVCTFLGHLLSSALTEIFQMSYIQSWRDGENAHT